MKRPVKQLINLLKMPLRVIFFVILFLLSCRSSNSQQLLSNPFHKKISGYSLISDQISEDTIKLKGKSKVQKVNIGGIFISPSIGSSFPLGTFGEYSNPGIIWGAKLELAYNRLYPLVFGFIYEHQTNKGNADYTTVNSLTRFDTRTTFIGGSLDIILNKYIKSDFTIPVFSIEIKYAKIEREILPSGLKPEIPRNESLLTYSAGLGFTIYVFDISAKYMYGKDFNNLTFQGRIHIPLIKF